MCVLVHERVGVSVCMRFCEECVYEHYFIYVFCESVCVGDCVSMGVCVCVLASTTASGRGTASRVGDVFRPPQDIQRGLLFIV